MSAKKMAPVVIARARTGEIALRRFTDRVLGSSAGSPALTRSPLRAAHTAAV
jgi:hypothetical protein